MKKLTRFAAILGALSGLLLGSASAAASPVFQENFRITSTDVGTDPCSEYQPVAVTETLHFVILVNADGAGGFHVNTTVNNENSRGINLVARLAGPLLAGLATLFPRPLLGLRLPALIALPLLALAHRFLLPE